MSAAQLDAICPPTMGDQKIGLAVKSTLRRVNTPIDIGVDYSDADPDGIVLPLELIVSSSSPELTTRRLITKFAPSLISFIPREEGDHLVTLREVFHNRWHGALHVDVPRVD